jgi:GT2 family glycosyltransferase
MYPDADFFVDDPGDGLASAIDAGIRSLPEFVEIVSWLGDDDLLEPQSLAQVSAYLKQNEALFVWGMCRYINESGESLFVNRSGSWALRLAAVGPNLVPQPGSVFLRSAYEKVGGLDLTLGWAFDQDLFARFSKEGRCMYYPYVVSSFRWHAGSLSAGSRKGSVTEASIVRQRYYGRILKTFAQVWEPPMRSVNSIAGRVANRRARRLKSHA